jgi:hypothetical protein
MIPTGLPGGYPTVRDAVFAVHDARKARHEEPCTNTVAAEEKINLPEDPHSYYCAECRATFNFHHQPDCVCNRAQEFAVMHRNSHVADGERKRAHATDPTYMGMYD